jgi:hypothetical protein
MRSIDGHGLRPSGQERPVQSLSGRQITQKGDDKAKMDQFVDQILALKDLKRLEVIALSILGHMEKHGQAYKRELDKVVSGQKHKNAQTIVGYRKRHNLSHSFFHYFDHHLTELQKLADRIEDERLRSDILYHCRNVVENAIMLGNIAMRDVLDEERDRLNGQKPKLSQKSEERRLKLEAKMSVVLRDDPRADWSAAWNRLYKDGMIRKLASRNTLEKDARAAYQKHFIEPPH